MELNARQKSTVLSTASTALAKLAGGDTVHLLNALREEPLPTSSRSNYTVLNSVAKVLSALGVGNESESAEVENVGEETEINPRTSHTDETNGKMRTLLVSLIDAGVSRAELLETGFSKSSYHRAKSTYDKQGIKASLHTFKRGRKDLPTAKPEILEKMFVHLHSSEISNYSNVAPHVDGSLNRSLERPYSRSFANVGFRKTVETGGGSSVHGKVSDASLYKYKPKTIKAASFNPYACSDCKQRKFDIDRMSRLLSDPSITLSHETSVPFFECMPPKPKFSQIVSRANLSRADTHKVEEAYTRLIGTQIHYCQKTFQVKLKSSILKQLPLTHTTLVIDFGENIKVGRSFYPTEGTERFLSLCTIFSAVLTYNFDVCKKNLHGLIFSNELKHTAFTATQCLQTFIKSKNANDILSRTTVLHVFADRGKHFVCQEFADFILRVVPTFFQNILSTFDHRHAAKHGRDIGDVAISIAQRATSELSMRAVGFRDPKKQLPDIREIISEYQQGADNENSKVDVLWYEAKKPQILYRHIKIDRMDASSCRRSTRKKPGGVLSFSDHVRFDVKIGVFISPILVESKHLGILSNPADTVKSNDEFVCSVQTQLFRQSTRVETLSFLSNAASSDLNDAISGKTPDHLPIDVNFDVISYKYSLRREKRKRGPPHTAPQPKLFVSQQNCAESDPYDQNCSKTASDNFVTPYSTKKVRDSTRILIYRSES